MHSKLLDCFGNSIPKLQGEYGVDVDARKVLLDMNQVKAVSFYLSENNLYMKGQYLNIKKKIMNHIQEYLLTDSTRVSSGGYTLLFSSGDDEMIEVEVLVDVTVGSNREGLQEYSVEQVMKLS